MKNVSVEEFEIHLDLLLSTVPDVKKKHPVSRGTWNINDILAETFGERVGVSAPSISGRGGSLILSGSLNQCLSSVNKLQTCVMSHELL